MVKAIVARRACLLAFSRAVADATAASANLEHRALLDSLQAFATCLPDVDSNGRNTLDFADFRHGKMVVENKTRRAAHQITEVDKQCRPYNRSSMH